MEMFTASPSVTNIAIENFGAHLHREKWLGKCESNLSIYA